MKPTKSELRQTLKRARLEMGQEAHRAASVAIVERLRQLMDWSRVKSLHYFEPIPGLMEPDIRGFITELEDKYPDLRLSIPKLIGGTWQLVSIREGTPPDKFDVVLVPMLGFDPQSLHRIGYGGGFYDRFLATQPQAKKIGICFEQGKVEKIPAEPHDVPLSGVITETAAYSNNFTSV